MTTDLFDLTGKIALVTGASRGIGEAAARLLAQQGAHVIISSRRQEGCEEVAGVSGKKAAGQLLMPATSATWNKSKRFSTTSGRSMAGWTYL